MKQIRQLFQVSVMLYFEGCIYSHFAWGYIKLCNLAIVSWPVCLLVCLSVIAFAHHKIPVPHPLHECPVCAAWNKVTILVDQETSWLELDITERGIFFFKFQHHPTFMELKKQWHIGKMVKQEVVKQFEHKFYFLKDYLNLERFTGCNGWIVIILDF